jgi:hypothetical protein
MCHGSRYLCSIDDFLNIFVRSRPEAAHFLQSNGLCRKACQNQLRVRNVDGVTSLAWHAVFMQHGRHACIWCYIELALSGQQSKTPAYFPSPQTILARISLIICQVSRLRRRSFRAILVQFCKIKSFSKTYCRPKSVNRTLSGKLSEADSTPISFTCYRSESCDSTDIVGNPGH